MTRRHGDTETRPVSASPRLRVPRPSLLVARQWAIPIGLFLASLLLRLLWIGQPIVVDSVEWLRRGARFLLALQAGDWAGTYGSAHPGVTNMWLIAAGLAGRALVRGEPLSTLAFTVLPRDAYPSLEYYIAARIPFALVTSLCAVLIYLWASRIHGREIALMAAVLLTLEPFWLGYNRVITTDAVQGNLMVLSLLAFLRHLHGHGRRWAVVSGILGGLAMVTKLPALILWPVVAIWAVLWRSRSVFDAGRDAMVDEDGITKSRRLAKDAKREAWPGYQARDHEAKPVLAVRPGNAKARGCSFALFVLRDLRVASRLRGPNPIFRTGGGTAPVVITLLAWGMLAAFTAAAVWPALWADPADVVQKVSAQITQVELGERHQFFLGRTVDAPGPAFYPLALLFRTSPLTLLAALGTCIALAIPATRRQEGGHGGTAPTPPKCMGDPSVVARVHPRLVTLWLIFLAALLAALTLAETKFDRYLIPAYPALALIAVTGLHALFRAGCCVLRVACCVVRGSCFGFRVPSSIVRRLPPAIALLVLAVAQAVFLFPRFPDLQAFYNPFSGGASAARQMLMIGNGEGLDQVGRWLSAQEGAANQMVAAWYPSVLAPFFVGRTIELNRQLPDGFWPWAMANHVVLYANQIQRRLPNTQITRYFQEQPAEFTARLAGIDYAWVYPGPMVPSGPLPAAALPLEAIFEGQLKLIGWEPPADPSSTGGGNLRLYWEVLKLPTTDLSVFIGLRDREGHLWGRHDRPPVDGFLPLDRWLPKMRIRDAQVVAAFPGTPPGTYELEVALFSPGLGRNLLVTDSSGTPRGDRLRLGTITIGPEPVPADPDRLEMGQRLDASMGEVILLGVERGADELPDGGVWPLVLWWQGEVTSSRSLNMGLMLVDENGQGWRRAARRPVGGAYPTDRWSPHVIVRDAWDALIPPGLSDGAYQAFIVTYTPDGEEIGRAAIGTVRVRGRPHTTTIPSMQVSVAANFGGKVELLGYDLTDAAGQPALRWRPGEAYTVTLHWQPKAEWGTSYIGFVHLLDANRLVVAQRDQVPGEGQLPTTGWLPGEVLADRYRLALPPELPAGTYTLEVGLYHPGSLERLPVLDAAGNPTADHVILGEVIVEAAP